MAPSVDKKIMAEKVARVQEVVNGITNNDIILALHSFDLDVERTIQALCEDKSAVLGEWEGGSTKSKKNKKKNNNANSTPASSLSNTTQVEKVVAVVPNIALTSQPKKLVASNGFQSTSHKNNVSDLELISQHEAEASQIAASFSQECAHGKDQIQSAFKALRQLLADREKSLLSALVKSQQDGEKLIQEGKKSAKNLLARARSNGTDETLTVDVKAFEAQKRTEQQLSTATAFQYDMTQLVQSITNFGKVIEVNKCGTTFSPVRSGPSPVAAIKHANSHSSIGSSDVDSGLGGHISPISVPEEKKVTSVSKTQVASGGIQMSSDGLSASQLEALQKNLQAQLAARGIDASLVTGGSGVLPPRPRNKGPRQGDFKKNQHKKGPELSILS